MDKFPCSDCKKECLSELLGTYLLVTIGPASIILTALAPGLGSLSTLVLVALTFGGIVGIVIIALGIFSGAVINPAITVGAGLARTLKSKYLIPYLFFQILGGLLAGLTLRAVFFSTSAATSLGTTSLSNGVNPVLGTLIEALGTFVLTISALVASSYIKGPKRQALLVGFTLFVLILLIGPLTGAGFNPARSLGPALASGQIQNLYVYLVGPIVGAVAAGLVFRGARNEQDKEILRTVCLC